jgi:hypothetical protein
MKAASAVLNTMALPTSGQFKTLDPFLFCVYHKDAYPPAHDDTMEAPQRGNGMDFDPSAPYRMYHGDKIPGTLLNTTWKEATLVTVRFCSMAQQRFSFMHRQ